MVTPAWFLRIRLNSRVGGRGDSCQGDWQKIVQRGVVVACSKRPFVPSAPPLSLCCLETFGENANARRQTEGPCLCMKTSTNTAATAQITAVKQTITTTDDSVATKKQEVGSKLREDAIRGVSVCFSTTGQFHWLRSTWPSSEGCWCPWPCPSGSVPWQLLITFNCWPIHCRNSFN